ncbi:MAG: diaminopimelate decarboxylase [Acidobacteria bacterium]|nr:MAG: diaminopimelate decarboxylase [Acidobacteriota bacterium]
MSAQTGFFRTAGGLVCDGVALASIAAAEGTPVYVYSAAVFRERYTAIDRAFGAYPHAIHYALKANSTLAIARLLRGMGSGADANSMWEIEVARRAGFDPSSIVFTGVGKSPAELECAVALGVKAINVESRVAVRVNPDIDAESHPHISTGLRINKFGLPRDQATELFASIAARPVLRLVAVHLHVGSQITSLEPLQRAAREAGALSRTLLDAGFPLEYVDLGGGLGIAYDDRQPPAIDAYVSALVAEVQATRLPVVVEPGRVIAGPAGALIARVTDIKPRDEGSDFAIIDAGMTELLRPALYGAYHRIEPVVAGAPDERTYEVVGPVCESSDVIGRDRRLPRLAVGDLVAIRDAGAYGSVMASNYNRRPLPCEVLVDRGTWSVIRRRQTVDDQLALES